MNAPGSGRTKVASLITEKLWNWLPTQSHSQLPTLLYPNLAQNSEGRPSTPPADPVAVLVASVTFSDQRGGGIETSFKGDKQGLGLTKRHQKRFEAQQMVVLLGSLDHN